MHGHENDATVTHHDSWLIMIHQLTSLHLRYIFASSTWPRIRTSCAITLAAMNANCAWLSIPTKDVDQRLQREQRHPVTSSHIQSHPHGGGTFTDSQIVNHVLSCVQLSCQLDFTSVFLKSGDRRQCWSIWQEVTWHTPRARSIRSILRDEQRERSRCRDRHVVIVLSSLYRILWQIPGDDCDAVILLTWCDAHAILDFGGRNNSASAQTSSGTTCFVSGSRNPWSLLADLNFEFRSTEDCEDWTTWLSSDQGHGLWNFWNSNEIPRMGAGYSAMSLSLLVLTCVRLIPLIPLFENQKSDCNAVFAKSSLHFARSAVRVSLGYNICKFWVPTMFSLIWSALEYTL